MSTTNPAFSVQISIKPIYIESADPLLSGVAAGRPVSLEELRYFSAVGEEYRLKSASSNSLKTLRPISSSSRAEEGSTRHQQNAKKTPLMEKTRWLWNKKLVGGRPTT